MYKSRKVICEFHNYKWELPAFPAEISRVSEKVPKHFNIYYYIHIKSYKCRTFKIRSISMLVTKFNLRIQVIWNVSLW